VKVFFALALACIQEKGEVRPDMIDVAEGLMLIGKSIRRITKPFIYSHLVSFIFQSKIVQA
jgi:hypothetical protein